MAKTSDKNNDAYDHADGMARPPKKRSLFIVGCFLMIIFGAAAGLMTLGMCTGSFGFEMFRSYFAHPALLVLNLLPPVLICLFFYAFFGRPWLGFLVGAGLCFAMGFAQSIKISECGDVILFTDFLKGGEGLSYFPPISEVSLSWLMIGALIFLVVVTALLVRLFRNRKTLWFAGRMLFAVAIAVALGVLSRNMAGIGRYDLSKYDLDNSSMTDSRSVVQEYVSKGFFYPFIQSAFSADPNEAVGGYSEGRAAELMSSYQDSAIPDDRRFSVITVQLESFADFSGCSAPSVDLASAYADLQLLKGCSINGKLITYYCGQDHSSAGLNVLSGYSRLPGARKQMESFVRYLSRQGYDCWGMHPDFPDIYGHARLFRELGFSSFTYRGSSFDSYGSTGNSYDSDWYLFGDAYKAFEEKSEAGVPQFVYIETTQNSAPYTDPAREEYTDGSLPEAASAALNDYLGGVRDTLLYLMNFLSRLETFSEPTVVLIYGDNMPDLGADAYAALGLEDMASPNASPQAKYGTSYYIWANGAAREKLGGFAGTGPMVSLNFLMGRVFELCGWEGSAFMKASSQAAKTVPVVTPERIGLYSTGGPLVSVDSLSLDQQTVLFNYLYEEYYCSYR